jgi:hypothetical protein
MDHIVPDMDPQARTAAQARTATQPAGPSVTPQGPTLATPAARDPIEAPEDSAPFTEVPVRAHQYRRGSTSNN